MLLVDFTPTAEADLKQRRKEFGILQDLLRKGFQPRTQDEALVFGDVRKKMRLMSDENGGYCTFCGTVKTIPGSPDMGFSRVLKEDAGVLSLENEEHRLVLETIKNADKRGMFDIIEDVNDLIKRFSEAKKSESAPMPTP